MRVPGTARARQVPTSATDARAGLIACATSLADGQVAFPADSLLPRNARESSRAGEQRP